MAADPKYDDLPAHLRHAKAREAEDAGEEAGRRRAAMIPMGLGLLLVAGLAGWQFVQLGQPIPRQSQPPTALTSDRTREVLPASQHDPLKELHAGATVSKILQLTPFDTPLTGEPADLKPYPGAQRVAGLARETEAVREEMTNWRIPEDNAPGLDAALDFYVNAGQERGFEVVARGDAQDFRRHVVMRRVADDVEANMAEVLSIHISGSAGSGALRVLVWLRSPTSGAMASPDER